MTTLCQIISRQVAVRPEAVYLKDAESDAQITYEQLLLSCLTIGRLLAEKGVRSGDTVSVVMPNGVNTMRLLLAGMYCGVIVNPVNLLSQPDQMSYVLAHSDCKLVLTSPDWSERVKGIVTGIDRPIDVWVLDPMASTHASGLSDYRSDDAEMSLRLETTVTDVSPALLMYTSGTTGRPKGVVLTQGQLLHNAQAIVQEHDLTESDRVLAVLPLYHINAFVVTMLAPLVAGGSLALTAKFSAGRFWSQVANNNCSWINLVPTMISYLLEGERPQHTFPRPVKFCRSASASLPPAHLSGFEAMFGIGVIETMGLTETAAPSFSNPLDPVKRKLGSVGCASGCEAMVVDADLKPVTDGVIGEVLIRGQNVMQGYYKNPDATAASFTASGWLRTGDLGYRDADGFFFITGRLKELIIKGGENIAPREIDEALLKHPDVLDAAAVGVPDKHYGQEIMACVMIRPGGTVTLADLTVFCEQTLGKFKTPKQIYIVDELPRGPSGKVQRLKLPEFVRCEAAT